MKLLLIRHGMTSGNQLKKYIGTTDEPLCEEGIRQLKKRAAEGFYPDCERVVISPMIRCVQTAEILFSQAEKVIEPQLRECDFGKFEGKNYEELKNDKEYIAWVNSNATLPFPGGENVSGFKKRCINAFEKMVAREGSCLHGGMLAFVVHGGTIMSVMERFDVCHREYFDYRVDNGEGFLVAYDGEKITVLRKLA